MGGEGPECWLQCAETCAAKGSKQTAEGKTKHAETENIEQLQTVPDSSTEPGDGSRLPLAEGNPDNAGSLPVEVKTDEVTNRAIEQIPESLKPEETTDDIVVELLGLPEEFPVEIPDGLLPGHDHQTDAKTTSGNNGIGGNILDMDPSVKMIPLKDLNMKPNFQEKSPPMEDGHDKPENDHLLDSSAPLLQQPLATAGAACCLTR